MNENDKVIPIKSYYNDNDSKNSKSLASRCMSCSSCSNVEIDNNNFNCTSCSNITYLLDTYLYYSDHSEATEEIIDAIWNLHYTKIQLQSLFKHKHTHEKPDVISTLKHLKRQLESLNRSLKELNDNPLHFFLAMIAKDTELMLQTQFWSELYEV